jgi:hypothetical protein
MRDTTQAEVGPCATQVILAAALLSATTLVCVPIELYRAAFLDFASASRDLLLALLAAGLLAFVLLALAVRLLPARLRGWAGPLLAGLAAYAWIRSWFFPGPSLSLDGSPVTADLSTGWAGLLVPLSGGALLAGVGARRPRVATALLAALLAGSLLQSLVSGASVWSAKAPSSRHGVASLLEWSRKENVLVLILDSLQSDVFEEVLEAEPRLRDELDGFRHFRLASSSAPTTYLSVPTIHSGFPYQVGQSVDQFYEEAVHEGSVLNRLASAGYRTAYAVGIDGCPKAVASCVSTAELSRSRVQVAVQEAAQLVDLGVYRALPDRPREAILRRGRGPLAAILKQGETERAQLSAAALARLASGSTATDSPATAKMIHSTLTHFPWVLQADCSMGERRFNRENARLQARCAFSRVVALLDRLRALGVYDVSSIVLLADHGYGLIAPIRSRFVTGTADVDFAAMVGAFNPIVLVKPAGAHGRLTTSDAPIELADVPRALCGEAGCSPAEGLRRLDAVDPGRTRTAFSYRWRHAYWHVSHIPGLVRYSIRGDITRPESWSRETAAYAPGTVIEFRRGGNLGLYARFGWGYRQKTHSWMADPRATVRLQGRFEPGRDYVLLLDAEPAAATPEAPKRVAVEVNGVEVGEVACADPDPRFETYRFTVPASALSRSPETTISFVVKAGPGDEEGRLAVRTVELRPRP